MGRELDIRVARVRRLVRAQAERMRTRALPRVQESQGRGELSGQTRQISAKKITKIEAVLTISQPVD
jgi:hypothetical protein